MITGTIIQFFLTFCKSLIISLPALEFALPSNIFQAANSLFGLLGYFFPVAALTPILLASLAVDNFRLFYAILLRIKSLIPTISST